MNLELLKITSPNYCTNRPRPVASGGCIHMDVEIGRNLGLREVS